MAGGATFFFLCFNNRCFQNQVWRTAPISAFKIFQNREVDSNFHPLIGKFSFTVSSFFFVRNGRCQERLRKSLSSLPSLGLQLITVHISTSRAGLPGLAFLSPVAPFLFQLSAPWLGWTAPSLLSIGQLNRGLGTTETGLCKEPKSCRGQRREHRGFESPLCLSPPFTKAHHGTQGWGVLDSEQGKRMSLCGSSHKCRLTVFLPEC